jgi:aldehyde dehydrogenase (NAD+)
VLTDLPHESELACEEVFGPAVGVWPTENDDEAIELANRTRYGLSASIFTRDLDVAKRFVEQVRAGILHVNSQTAGAEIHVPFGGLAATGYGPHEQGRAAIEFFTEQKTVYLDSSSPQ